MMKSTTSSRLLVLRLPAGAVAMMAAVAACATSEAPTAEPVETQSAADFANGGFEMGAAAAAPMSWTVTDNLNNGITVQTPQTFAGLDLVAGGKGLTTTIAEVGQPDPDLGPGASLRVCRYGAQCARVNFHSSTAYGNGKNVNTLSQSMTITAGDVDPVDQQIHVRVAIAPVLQNPAHPADEQPYYFVILKDVTTNTVLYSDFNLSGTPGLAWQKVNAGAANEIDYTDWQLVDVSGAGGTMKMGDSVELQVIGSGCSPGGHFGEVYVDGSPTGGAVLPGIFVYGSGPAQANAGANITYNLTYENGSAAAETAVVIDFNTPPGTTFQSITPPAGATCTTPAVGSAGTIACTFATAVAAGASGSLAITVNITATTTGTIAAGQYQISSTQEKPLLGPPIFTVVGCTLDAQCASDEWCDESADECDPKLANGKAIPTDGKHANPTLNGICSAAASALVCTSGVCDTKNNECGYENGDGPCASGGAACQSLACDPDGKCGYANGDGPCTGPTGPTVCRSGACSANGTCEPAGGCNVDADCAGGQWCDETTHTCTAKEPNGTLIPTDPPHANPTLDGMCTAAAGALVCVSGVCDTDNKCGYANGDGKCTATDATTVCRSGACDKDGACGYAGGDGPCTATDGSTVCRSGMCGANGECTAPAGCTVDAECTGGQWCDESTATCTAPLANGVAVPNDPPHMNPTLDGTCTPAAGALVCVSGVCDTKDNACGYANGDGPCSDGDGGAAVCRTGICNASGTCGAADAGAGTEASATLGPDASNSGYVEGGGCAIGRVDGQRAPAAEFLVALGLALGARRRRRSAPN